MSYSIKRLKDRINKSFLNNRLYRIRGGKFYLNLNFELVKGFSSSIYSVKCLIHLVIYHRCLRSFQLLLSTPLFIKYLALEPFLRSFPERRSLTKPSTNFLFVLLGLCRIFFLTISLR
jgi:hypothetical protein